MSQDEAILEYLKKGGTLTPLEALDKFKCMRLSARANTLKKRGYNVVSRMVEVSDSKHVSEYRLA